MAMTEWRGDFGEDARVKWEEGRRKYGPSWVGATPLEEMYEEQLDAWNYVEPARLREQITLEEALELQRLTRVLGEHIWQLLKAWRERENV